MTEITPQEVNGGSRRGSISNVTIAILGVVAVVFAVTCIVFAAARVRNYRRQKDRLSIAFERAQELGRGAACYW